MSYKLSFPLFTCLLSVIGSQIRQETKMEPAIKVQCSGTTSTSPSPLATANVAALHEDIKSNQSHVGQTKLSLKLDCSKLTAKEGEEMSNEEERGEEDAYRHSQICLHLIERWSFNWRNNSASDVFEVRSRNKKAAKHHLNRRERERGSTLSTLCSVTN